MDRIDNEASTPFTSKIYQVVHGIECEINIEASKSPLRQIKLNTWEDYAH